MARETREVLVCDLCGSDKEVMVVAVSVDGAEQSGELCAEHRQALQEAIAGILPGLAPTQPEAPAQQAAPRRSKSATSAATKLADKLAERRRTPKRKVTCPHCGLEMSIQNLGRHIAAKHPGVE
jgi:transcription elongation factor Elf1